MERRCCRHEGDQQVEVAVVAGLEGVDVVAAVVSGYDNRQVVVLDEMPGDQRPRHPAVAVLEGVDLREPVVEPRRHQQRVVDVRLTDVLAVPGEQIVELGVDVFRRAVLVDDDDLVQLPDGGAADRTPAADFTVHSVEGRHVVLQDGQEVVRILSGAATSSAGAGARG